MPILSARVQGTWLKPESRRLQIARAGLDPKLMLPIDNSCPESVTAGASATDDIKVGASTL